MDEQAKYIIETSSNSCITGVEFKNYKYYVWLDFKLPSLYNFNLKCTKTLINYSIIAIIGKMKRIHLKNGNIKIYKHDFPYISF